MSLILSEKQALDLLFDAIGEGNIERVRYFLLVAKDPVSLMSKKDLQGLTPLRKAMALSQPDIAGLLVMNGADASQKGALDKTALHEAALMGQRSLIAPLLSSPNISVNVKDKFGMTPLHNAVRGKHVKAVEWLLFAGADVSLTNHHGDSPVSMCSPDSDNEADRQIAKLLAAHVERLDPLDLKICCGYIGQKMISSIGPDNSLTFVTSDLWPTNPHFVFGVMIIPELAEPQIPLRQDERFYSYVYKYRLMYTLPEGKRRVQIYTTILEEFHFSELIMKVTSKSKFLGEVPVTITTYPQHKYINYLGSCEFDLQNEGQFVLVKRPRMTPLLPDVEEMLGYYKVPLFKFAATKNSFPNPPAMWNKMRRSRCLEEHQKLLETVKSRHTGQDETGGDATANSNVRVTDGRASTFTTAAKSVVISQSDNDDESGESEGEQLVLLDWSEPDMCEDFYYISQGWTCHLEFRRHMTVETINRRFLVDIEEPSVRAITDFFRIVHPNNSMKGEVLMQMPKPSQFVKLGTVIVLQRNELGADEKDDPIPDDSPTEMLLSDDGRNTNGKIWLAREMKRWSFLPTGFISKPTRILFKANKLCTYVAVQLNSGEEKWELESDESDSDEDSEDDQGEGGEGEEGGAAEGEEGESKKKKKKKKKKRRDEDGEEGGEGENQEADENASNIASNAFARSTKSVIAADEDDPAATMAGGVTSIDEEFAVGLDKVNMGNELKDGSSSENLNRTTTQSKTYSVVLPSRLTQAVGVGKAAEQIKFGPPKKEDIVDEDTLQSIYQQVAANWRSRNHREVKVLAFSRHKGDTHFDLIIEIVQESDLTVRAESRWSDGFRMVAASAPFLSLVGQRYIFRVDGAMCIESPADAYSRSLLFYAIHVNELGYAVKRKANTEDAGPALSKKAKKKEDHSAISNEIDCTIEVLSYLKGLESDATECMKVNIPLSGPNIWTEQHLLLRIPDNILLDDVITCLTKDAMFTINWWKIWILLNFDEKQVDVEKVKQDWPSITEMMLKKWFHDNIDASDRGLTKLMYILDTLQLDVAHYKLLNELKAYKRKILDYIDQPRQLDLLFHWCKSTKMTADSFRRKIKEPPTLSPLSDSFLLYLNELLNPEIFFDIGRQMDVEDNVLHSINGEENISDPRYKTLKILIRSRSKKDEVVGYTLMLSELVINLDQAEAYEFLVRETRRWMASVVDTFPDTCNKLENLLRNLIYPKSTL